MFGRLKDWRRIATHYDRCPQGLPVRHPPRRNRLVLAVNINEMEPRARVRRSAGRALNRSVLTTLSVQRVTVLERPAQKPDTEKLNRKPHEGGR